MIFLSSNESPGVQVWQVWMQGWTFGNQGGRTGFFFLIFRLFVVVTILIPFLTVFQATRCSFSGKLASDPDSTVYISGCAEKESIDISVMSKKVNATCHRLLPPSYDPHNAHAIASPFFSPLLLLFYSSLALSSSSLLCQRLHLLMTCFQSKLQFNTYRVGKSGKI